MRRRLPPVLSSLLLLLVLVSLGYGTSRSIAESPLVGGPALDRVLVDKINRGDYSRRGADSCLGCHDESNPFPTHQLFNSIHGAHGDRSPFGTTGRAPPPAGLQCEACHGPAGQHVRQILPKGDRREPMVGFGRTAGVGPDLQNAMCLVCHDDFGRKFWQGSAHDAAQISCADCHRIHAADDPVQQTNGEREICGQCHRDVLADLHRRSSHPLGDNQLKCSDCHGPHGSNADDLLTDGGGNSTCFRCHADKRGPFLWEHEPAAEDCSICHVPHGSNQPALLKRRAPHLCQACHTAAGHRNFPQTVAGIPPQGASEYLLGNACLNCHTEVHGSNHPSGNKLRR